MVPALPCVRFAYLTTPCAPSGPCLPPDLGHRGGMGPLPHVAEVDQALGVDGEDVVDVAAEPALLAVQARHVAESFRQVPGRDLRWFKAPSCGDQDLSRRRRMVSTVHGLSRR